VSTAPLNLLAALHAQACGSIGLRDLVSPTWFEVETGIFGADGEGVGVFARELPDGHFTVSDLGTLEQQRTHASDLTDEERRGVAALAEGHRCRFLLAVVETETDLAGLWDACLRVALVQIAAEGLIAGMRQGASAAQAESKR
jgi:hypothetical protein